MSVYSFNRNINDNHCLVKREMLVITHKSSRRRESGLLDDFALQILRFAQNDKTPGCHSERSEESLAGLWVITRESLLTTDGDCVYYLGRRVFYILKGTSDKMRHRY